MDSRRRSHRLDRQGGRGGIEAELAAPEAVLSPETPSEPPGGQEPGSHEDSAGPLSGQVARQQHQPDQVGQTFRVHLFHDAGTILGYG